MSELVLEQANAIIEKAAELKIKPLGVVVLDDGGNVISAQRQDGASMSCTRLERRSTMGLKACSIAIVGRGMGGTSRRLLP